MAGGDQAVRRALSALRVIGTNFCKLLIQLVREIFQFSGKIQKKRFQKLLAVATMLKFLSGHLVALYSRISVVFSNDLR